jgi:hypothetical protein
MSDFGYIQLGMRGKCAVVPGFKNRRRRPLGEVTPKHAPLNTKGGASSAAKMNGTTGVSVQTDRVWIPGEGWVKWVEIKRQVAVAYEAWRVRKAQQGIKIVDAWELRAADIEEAMARRAAA